MMQAFLRYISYDSESSMLHHKTLEEVTNGSWLMRREGYCIFLCCERSNKTRNRQKEE